MAFGMGKSNAKVYVQSTQGIHFSDVAGEDEAKENLKEIVDYLHNPKKYTDVGAVSYTHLDVTPCNELGSLLNTIATARCLLTVNNGCIIYLLMAAQGSRQCLTLKPKFSLRS